MEKRETFTPGPMELAAPDMYAALEAADAALSGVTCHHKSLAIDLAHAVVSAALRKARGESAGRG